MNQWIVPNWDQSDDHQIVQQQDSNKSCTNKTNPSFSHDLVNMPKYEEGMEKRWESKEEGSLESIVNSSILSRKRTWSNQECKDQTFMSLASLESHSTFNSKHSHEDLAHNDALHKVEEHNMKGKTDGSCSNKPTRAAIYHNQSESRRKNRINEKMKDLQKLVPNGSKTDSASLLDDTIQYLKQLQAQLQLMCTIRSSSIMPLGIQQQQQILQMSVLAARTGLLNRTDSMAPSSGFFPCAAAFPPPFLLPSIIPTAKPKSSLSTNGFVPPTDPFCTFLAQSMDMDLYSKMVTLYCQEVNKTTRLQPQRKEGIEEESNPSMKYQ